MDPLGFRICDVISKQVAMPSAKSVFFSESFQWTDWALVTTVFVVHNKETCIYAQIRVDILLRKASVD